MATTGMKPGTETASDVLRYKEHRHEGHGTRGGIFADQSPDQLPLSSITRFHAAPRGGERGMIVLKLSLSGLGVGHAIRPQRGLPSPSIASLDCRAPPQSIHATKTHSIRSRKRVPDRYAERVRLARCVLRHAGASPIAAPGLVC
ncbi:hypothetical protein FALCPG4_004458 [Fusarium falciforme]